MPTSLSLPGTAYFDRMHTIGHQDPAIPDEVTVSGSATINGPWATGTLAIEPKPTNLTLALNGEVLVTIKPDGEIVRGPAFTTTDQASLEFWNLLSSAFPIWLQRAKP